ncbi:MAG TPA: acetylxylan esterase, partial [Caulobacteraceae bacterium]
RLRELHLLGLSATRPGVQNRDPTAPAYANYDEAKANPIPLPDPLVELDGRRAATAEAWWTVRRPQIVAAADRNLYGRQPAHTPKVRWLVTQTSHETRFGVAVVVKSLEGRLDNRSDPAIDVRIQAELTTPEAAIAAHRKTPVVMSLIWLEPPVIPGLEFTPEPGPDYRQQILDRGWSYILVDPNSIQADNGAGLTSGVIGLGNHGQPRGLEDWGVLRAWAWGASRALDYLATDPNTDAARVAIQGHSRYGKASLVAMAYDRRFATGFISSSGAGGAAPYRRHFGEQVENLAASNEYHWMAGEFLEYAAGPLHADDLPIDSNAVIALAAPRPIFIGAGSADAASGKPNDAWVDPRGMFMAEASAGAVYRLLGKRPLDPVFPPVLTLSDSGDMAYREHDRGHTPGPNWPQFLDFAARAFARQGG